MTPFQAIILGLVQGLTEFFPISSSAHLKLAKWLMGIQDGEHLVYFDLVCHVGTLLALLIYLRRDVWEILRDWRKMAIYAAAVAPLVPGYFLLKPVRMALSEPGYLGYALMATAGLLFAATRKKESWATLAPAPNADHRSSIIDHRFKWSHVVCIGVMQTLALIPGISRSGSTIAAARFCGWNWREAARFSFLLAVPTILGGEVLELMKSHAESGVAMSCYGGALAASFGMGLLAVRFVFWIYENGKVRPFAWYCLAAGLFAWIMLNG